MNIVLFDGVCNLCNASVRFLIKHDKKQVLHFASQQSEAAQQLFSKYAIQASTASIIFIKDNRVYQQSDAIFAIARCLVRWPKLLVLFSFLPKKWCDGVYRFIAKHRYQWFGRKEVCSIPSSANSARFLS